ncbi:Putative ribonuclease H protein At1g65750 [Linum perenne]
MRADLQVISGVASRRIEAHIGWKAGPCDSFTINTDGSVLHPHSLATAGGILCNWQGRPECTFAANLGRCSIMRGELRAAEFDLVVAWDRGYKKVHLQLDSLVAIKAGDQEEDSRHGRITNRRTWDYTTVRIVDQCRLKYRKIEVDYETVFKPLDTDGYARKIGQMWVEFHFVSCFQ